MTIEEAHSIIKEPYITEKTFDMIEKENKIVFIVDENASKELIKKAVETLYKVKVESVNTMKTIRANKAYVKLSKESSAANLASKLGLV